MSDNKKLAQQFYLNVFNDINETVAHEILAEEFKVHALPPLKPIIGVDTFLTRVKAFHHAFPDVKYVVEDQVAEGDKVATRFSASGTHTNAFLGVDATNKKVTWTGIAIHHIKNGKIIENWVNADFLGLKNQLQA